jgi:parallel beta-helix repeat protein
MNINSFLGGEKMGKQVYIGLLFTLVLINTAICRTITVKPDGTGDYSTIQTAINASKAGDIIIVEPGTYTGNGNRNIFFMGKAITIRSTDPNDPNVVISTVIDCQATEFNNYSGFYFSNHETNASCIAGLTITNGYSSSGAAITCSSSSPTITNCIISNNTGKGSILCQMNCSPAISNCSFLGNVGDAAIYCDSNSNPDIRNCTFRQNDTGIYCYPNSSPSISGCTIEQNGEGIYCNGNSSPDISNCIIEQSNTGIFCSGGSPIIADCTIWQCGIGIFCEGGSPVISNCAIGYNENGGIWCYSSGSQTNINNCSISNNGIGIYCWENSTPTIVRSAINHNDYGIYCEDSSPTITNCIITQNNDSGINCYASTHPTNPLISNCTIAQNSVNDIYCYVGYTSCNPVITNSILWSDASPEIYGGQAMVTVTFSDVRGGWTGMGNINIDPCFALPNDFHLMAGSPCIDTGTNTPPNGLAATDFDGFARPFDGDGNGTATADIGAFEYDATIQRLAVGPDEMNFIKFADTNDVSAQVLSVRNSSSGTLHWQVIEDCPWLLVSALSGESNGETDTVAVSVDITGLAPGLYDCMLTVSNIDAPTQKKLIPINLSIGTERLTPSHYATIQEAIDASHNGDIVIIAPGIYTGEGNRDIQFRGKAIKVQSADPNDPGIVASTIVDCQGTASENHSGFFLGHYETNMSELTGLTITNGYNSNAGGIYCWHSSPKIRNCIISHNINNSYSPGSGGIFCSSGSNATISNCTINNNTFTHGSGGGISCSDSTVSIVNCSIAENTASGQGGGVKCSLSSGAMSINGCDIKNNTAVSGGGVCTWSGTGAGIITITNCSINQNTSTGNGGGFYCSAGSAIITNSTIENNTATISGGGVYCNWSSSPIFRNSVITRNRAGSGGGIACMFYSSPNIVNCTITANTASSAGGGIYCYGINTPVITNTILWADSPAEINGGSSVVTYSDIQGGWTETSNINLDPLFIDANNPDPNKCNFHLQPRSPCINTGDPNFISEPSSVDIDGQPRVIGNRVDIGADEFVFIGDFDSNGREDLTDFAIFASAWMSQPGQPNWNPACDISDPNDNIIDWKDLAIFTGEWLAGVER